MVNPDRVAINPPTRVRFDRVRADEILIVFMVLLVWAGAVYIFFNQWGKLLGTSLGARAYLLLLYCVYKKSKYVVCTSTCLPTYSGTDSSDTVRSSPLTVVLF